MQLGYNTNGLAHHRLLDAIALLREIGYRGVAISLDHGALDPYDEQLLIQLQQVAEAIDNCQLACVIETGARYLLDPRVKHEPTLVTADPAGRARRVDFLCRAIDVAARLDADCVSLWSGTVRDGAGGREAFRRLSDGLAQVIQHADRQDVTLAFEPEPEMFIDTLDRYGDLLDELESRRVDTSGLQLTLDIGHLHCQG
jgi:sugar phosphate isomerase/epimerase